MKNEKPSTCENCTPFKRKSLCAYFRKTGYVKLKVMFLIKSIFRKSTVYLVLNRTQCYLYQLEFISQMALKVK